MAGEDWLSALLGGFEGGFAGWSNNKKRQAEEERQRKIDARQAEEDTYRAEQREFQRQERERQARDRLRTETESMLGDIGRGGRLTPEQAEGARGVGLGHRVEDDVDFNHSIFAGAGPIPMMVPERVSEVAPTGAERRADAAARLKAEEDARRRAAEAAAIDALPDHLRPVARFGSTTGKMPTLGATDFVSPEQRTEQEIARDTAKAKALLPIKLRERAAEKDVDRRYAEMPIPVKDDPALPRGVRSYLGDLVARYQTDPAGARAELQRAAPSLLGDHPNLDVAKVMQQMNAMLPVPKEPIDASGDPNEAPVEPMPPTGPRRMLDIPLAAEKAKVPIPLAQQPPRPDARSVKASVLMQQIAQGRKEGRDTTALEQQLVALKRGAGAAVVH